MNRTGDPGLQLLRGKDHGQEHLEILCAIDCVGLLSRHDQRFACPAHVVHAVHREAAHALQDLDQSVAPGFMGTDLLSLGKGEEGETDGWGLVLRSADDLSRLGLHLACQREHLFRLNIF